MAPKCEPLCQFSDRLYFTTFPNPAPHATALNGPAAEPGNVPCVRARPRGGPSATPDDDATYYYFTIDDHLRYLSFFQDWGPLNLAMVYKACILIHELLEDESLAQHRLVFYSSDDPRNKANAALLMALYVMIVQRRAPWEAFHPIAEIEFMPFRDAGRGPPDFNLNIQDCLWGIWKAMQHGLCDMNEFSVEDYEYYEKVENGDWNWITPNFIAFASPVDVNWVKKKQTEAKETQRAPHPATPTRNGFTANSSNLALQRKLPTPFLNCLDYFERRNIKLVVRLNTPLYDKTLFMERGIEHLELYFDDGTNPTDEIVRTFIDVSDRIIENGGVVAVHCKAGLGRTGSLIGAYLIWKYGFTANEAIAFMRIVRPGSVVGPQQQYMYLKQLEWAKWAAVDEMRKAQAQSANSVANSALVTPATPPAEPDDTYAMQDVQLTPTTELRSRPMPPVTPSRHVAEAAAKARAITPPGQPRKTPVAKRIHTLDSDDDSNDILPALGVVPARRPRKISNRGITASESRPARVTRSTAGAALIKKSVNTSASTPAIGAPLKEPPNKIPKLTTTTTRSSSAAKHAAATAAVSKLVRPPTSIPSRLPTLSSPTRKPLRHNPTNSLNVDTKSTSKQIPKAIKDVVGAFKSTLGDSADAWMTNNTNAVVVPAKSGRPGLRPIRRRRSSFSSADVVA